MEVAGNGRGDDKGSSRRAVTINTEIGKTRQTAEKQGRNASRSCAVLTDGNGIPIGVEVASAHRHDSKLVAQR